MSEFSINDFLKQSVRAGASDVHLREGERPAIRVAGKMMRINNPPLTADDFKEILDTVVPTKIKDRIDTFLDLDFSYELQGISRFRVNFGHALGKITMVYRTIPFNPKNLNELGMPETINDFANFNNGLILVTGPTGSGKSTTIAALVDFINSTMSKHIITLEDPVEFIFNNKKSIISQRQLIIDTPTFPSGMKYALRQDPDIIFIGEIRDRDTVEAALAAAETGHLVISTIHTNNAVQTVSRIINMFEPSERDSVRSQLASTLRGTVAQKLVPTIEGNSRVPAPEVLVVTPTVQDFILKDELEQVYSLVKSGSYNSMITMNMSLFKLYKENKISKDVAIASSDNRTEIEQMMRGVYHGTGV